MYVHVIGYSWSKWLLAKDVSEFLSTTVRVIWSGVLEHIRNLGKYVYAWVQPSTYNSKDTNNKQTFYEIQRD
jgi:hypothetical protein